VIDRAVTHFGEHARGQLVASCGAGKTIISLQIARALDVQRLAITVPSLQLVNQWLRVARRQFGAPATLLAVCSDPGVDAVGERYRATVTTRVADVQRAMLDAQRPGAPPLIVLCTYQSSSILAEATRATRHGTFDLLLADEAHRTAGEGADHSFRRVVLPAESPGSIRATRRLFMTATPRDCPTADSQRHRAHTVPLTAEDATRVGVEQFRYIPTLEHRDDPLHFRAGPLLRGDYLPDGSLLAVRALVPYPFVDAEAHHPHELVRILADPLTGAIHPTQPLLDSTMVVPDAESVAAATAAVRTVLADGVLTAGMGIGETGRFFAQRSTAPFYMDDRALFGEIIADIPDAVVEAAGFTAPYRIVLLGVRQSDINAALSMLPALPAIPSAELEQMVATQWALTHAAEAYGIQKALVFNGDIAAADTFASLGAWAIPRSTGAGPAPHAPVTVTALHTGIRPTQRTHALARFAAETKDVHVLSAVRMGMEGQDIPATDTVIFTSPKDSTIDVVQAKGRAVRRDPARPEKVANMLIPIILRDAESATPMSAAQRIAPHSATLARSLIAALRATDDRALARVVADGTTATRGPEGLTTTVSVRRGQAPIVASEELDRAVRHLADTLSHDLANVSLRRYAGVAFDPTVDAFRATITARFPGSDATRRVVPLLDSVHPTGRSAAEAVDRVIDEFGLTPALSRNFGRAFPLRHRDDGAHSSTYSGVFCADADASEWVAVYAVQRTGAVMLRYAATEHEAALMRDALAARYGSSRRACPGAPRHDLTSRAPHGDGVEFDPAARRWWAFVTAPQSMGQETPQTVGLGFFATETIARRAVQIAHTSVAKLDATPTMRLLDSTVRYALDAAGIQPVVIGNSPMLAADTPRVQATPLGPPDAAADERRSLAIG